MPPLRGEAGITLTADHAYKYVYEYMEKNGCRIGGGQSDYIIFSKYISTGNGILTSLKMMEVMLAKKLPMSKRAEPLEIYPQVLENVCVTDKKAAQDDEAVQAADELCGFQWGNHRCQRYGLCNCV